MLDPDRILIIYLMSYYVIDSGLDEPEGLGPRYDEGQRDDAACDERVDREVHGRLVPEWGHVPPEQRPLGLRCSPCMGE
jgi:hypothetical protein